MDKIFIVIDINLAITQDVSIPCVFGNIEDAFKYALDDVIKKDGRDIKVHGCEIEGYISTTDRISNNNSLGSNYGVSYKSYYGGYPCARMIMERKVN
jgi:hypothetical protein